MILFVMFDPLRNASTNVGLDPLDQVISRFKRAEDVHDISFHQELTMNAKKQTTPTDWHPADIKAALAKKGYTFARIAREHGYCSNSPNSVLWVGWKPMERIVADIVGVQPEEIWPSRYGAAPPRFITRKKRSKTEMN